MARPASHEWMRSFRGLMGMQTAYLKYSGLWDLEPGRTRFIKRLHFIYGAWMLSMMYIFAITLFADIYANIGNLSVTTDDGCIFAGILVVIFKAMNYQLRRKQIARLLEQALGCADDLCNFSETERVKDIIAAYQIRNRAIFYAFTVLGCVLGVALLFFTPMENGLPVRAMYPFDTTISPWHEIGLTVETCAISAGLIAIIGMDSTMTSMSSLLTALFDALSVNFENCSSQEKRDDREASEFVRRYKKCLQFHQRLACTTNEYNRIYNASMFVQILSSTSIICLTGFQAIVVGGQNSDVMKFVIYLSAAISQLLYNCWIGNELSYASSVLDRSQWLSGWHRERLTDIVQMFALSTMFSRRPITLKAGAFYVLSLQTFIAIIRSSYSVFTLLNNVHATGS